MKQSKIHNHGKHALEYSAGLTLIELLVVISVISMLSSIAMIGMNNARKQARDLRRVKDIQLVQQGLELYYQDKGYYPGFTTTTSGSAVYSTTNGRWKLLEADLKPYIQKMPQGFSGTFYYYSVQTIVNVPMNVVSVFAPQCPGKAANMKANSYWLYSQLENPASNPQYRPGGGNNWPGSGMEWYYMIFGGGGTGAFYWTNC